MPSHVEDMLLGPFSHRLAARWSSLTSQGTLQWEHLFIGFAGGDVYDRKRLRGSDGKEHGLHSSLHSRHTGIHRQNGRNRTRLQRCLVFGGEMCV